MYQQATRVRMRDRRGERYCRAVTPGSIPGGADFRFRKI